jgi:5S rRNA maturation endonuclease (ribonuclease M5)
MKRGISRSPRQRLIPGRVVVLCEGKTDVAVLSQLLPEDSHQLVAVGGKGELGRELSLMAADQGNLPRLRGVIVVRDADEDGSYAWRAIQQALWDQGFEAPGEPGHWSSWRGWHPPAMGWVMGVGQPLRGDLETRILSGLEGSKPLECVRRFFHCLGVDHPRSKNLLQAWLAGLNDRDSPTLTVASMRGQLPGEFWRPLEPVRQAFLRPPPPRLPRHEFHDGATRPSLSQEESPS